MFTCCSSKSVNHFYFRLKCISNIVLVHNYVEKKQKMKRTKNAWHIIQILLRRCSSWYKTVHVSLEQSLKNVHIVIAFNTFESLISISVQSYYKTESETKYKFPDYSRTTGNVASISAAAWQSKQHPTSIRWSLIDIDLYHQSTASAHWQLWCVHGCTLCTKQHSFDIVRAHRLSCDRGGLPEGNVHHYCNCTVILQSTGIRKNRLQL